MAENELRKHLRSALEGIVGLNTPELTKVVKHLEKHGVTVSATAKAKPKKKAAPKKKAEPKAAKKAEPKPAAKPEPDPEVTSTLKSTWSFKPKENK